MKTTKEILSIKTKELPDNLKELSEIISATKGSIEWGEESKKTMVKKQANRLEKRLQFLKSYLKAMQTKQKYLYGLKGLKQ